MAAQTHSPGMHWPLWLRHVALRNGILAGIYLSCVLVVWLEVANRVRELESFAGTRNFVAAALFVALAAIPVLRFRQDPGKLFLAGLTELNFKLLESRMGFLHVFMLGAVSYGFVAVLDWVFLMCAEARQQHIAQTREASALAGRRRAE
jgi:hypothetical protein